MKTLLASVAVVGALLLASAGPLFADDLHLCATATSCGNNSLAVTTTTDLYVDGQNPDGGDVYLAVLTPESDTSDGFTSTTDFYTVVDSVLGKTLTVGVSQPEWSDFEDQYSLATGLTANSFDVELHNLGDLSLSENAGILTGVTIQTGDAALAFIVDGTTVTAVSPNSSDFVVGTSIPTPESSSLLLLGLGLGALCLLKVRQSATTR